MTTTRNRIAAATLTTIAILGSAATATASPSRTGTSGDENSSGLSRILADARTASPLVGQDVTVTGASTHLNSSKTPIQPARCTSAYMPGQYESFDTVPVAVAGQQLDGAGVSVFEWVIQMPTKNATKAQLQSTIDGWTSCSGVTVTSTTSDGDKNSWQLGEPRPNTDNTIMTLAQQGVRSKSTCERAIAGQSDLIYDVMTCSNTGPSAGTAAAIVEAIARNAKTQST